MKTIVFKSDIELSNTGNCNLNCLEFRLRITLAFLKRLFKGNLKMSSSETEMASSREARLKFEVPRTGMKMLANDRSQF